jgi:polyhydroxybutyrate depolymerase
MCCIAPSQQITPTAARAKRFRIPAGRFHASSGLASTILWLCLPIWLATLPTRAAEPLAHRRWTVDGISREALVYVPPQARSNLAPVVFAFHGHGGSMHNAARTFSLHTHWPKAIVVYLQGLDTPGRLTDPAGAKPGWQRDLGDQGDRDLKFFDAVLASLQQDYRVDAKRLYATGHSNGGAFTYLLWAARGDKFAAFAPSAAAAIRNLPQLKPKPVLHVAGENDTLVKFAWQQQTIAGLRKLNHCGAGQPWENQDGCSVYPSKLEAPVVTFIHHGAHQYPSAAPAIIVKFFQQHALPHPAEP